MPLVIEAFSFTRTPFPNPQGSPAAVVSCFCSSTRPIPPAALPSATAREALPLITLLGVVQYSEAPRGPLEAQERVGEVSVKEPECLGKTPEQRAPSLLAGKGLPSTIPTD